MGNQMKYWRGEEELLRTPEFLESQKNEFSEGLPLDEVLSESHFELNSNRRDFLKFFGFSVTAVALAACNKAPVRNAIPYLVKPEEITPGVANYYSSTCGTCSVGCGIEVKTREGRPIKVDGNSRSPISGGALCATGQASILSLYDTERLANPRKNGKDVSWEEIDKDIKDALSKIAAANGKIAIVTSSISSPSTLSVIKDFSTKYPTSQHITYDPVSYSGIILANKNTFGKATFPSYKFDKATVIVSFGADFLGTWGSPVEYSKAYITNRIPGKTVEMSKHFQFESTLSLTGTNADHRFPMMASKEGAYLLTLYNYIAEKAGARMLPNTKKEELAGNSIKTASEALWKAKSTALVVSGSNDPSVQSLVNGINMLLGGYGTTIDLDNASNQYKGNDEELQAFTTTLLSGGYAAVLFYNSNPVYNHNKGKEIAEAIKKLQLSVSFAGTEDETAKHTQYICPDNHYLESWNDAEPRIGVYQLTQPTISPVFNTRQAQESLLVWSDLAIKPEKDAFASKNILNQKHESGLFYNYIKNYWSTNILGMPSDIDTAFNNALHDGVFLKEPITATVPAFMATLDNLVPQLEKASNGTDLILYQKVAVKEGEMANNPWVHEMPDPISKITWDNYVTLPKALAESIGLESNDTVTLTVNGNKIPNIPAFVQPGQTNNTIGLALGYGRKGKIGTKDEGFEPIGVNAYPLVGWSNGNRNYVVSGVSIEKGSKKYELAQTQTHFSFEGRDIIRESSFDKYRENPKTANDKPKAHLYTLWEKHEYKQDGAPNHRWAMAIDLNACTGCGSCVVSCSIENNVPVVGRDEVRRKREMHWIRIDRYFSFGNVNNVDYRSGVKFDKDYEGAKVTKEKGLEALDAIESANKNAQYNHWENVTVVHQPMMCQHCDQAPCETVCPVLATTHSTEGLNQMTYNRCIGTKYCANNCPYKVRRFNWFRYNDNDRFDFHFNNDLGKMVINPDVTVRTRGVMEKCSFCVQKIQESKLKAKRERRPLQDGEIKTACQKTCPTNAIVFGDVNDPNSEVSKLYKNERSYALLEELNVQPSVKYMTKIRNTEPAKA